MHIRATRAKPPANARHLGANGCRPASVPATGSAASRERNGSIVLPNRAVPGAGSVARGDQHALAIGGNAAASRVLPGATANRAERSWRLMALRHLLCSPLLL